MATQGQLLRLEAAPGRDQELQAVLAPARYAVRFGRSEYGAFGFPDAPAVASDLLAGAPRSSAFSILASKQADGGSAVTRALLLTLRAKKGQAAALERLLRAAPALLDAEAGTSAWFALRFGPGSYGIFAAFGDNGARFAHLSGPVLGELTQQALALLDGVPDMDLLDVLPGP